MADGHLPPPASPPHAGGRADGRSLMESLYRIAFDLLCHLAGLTAGDSQDLSAANPESPIQIPESGEPCQLAAVLPPVAASAADVPCEGVIRLSAPRMEETRER